MLPREKGRRSHFITTSELTRGVVPKLVRQHILLILILRISDPGAPAVLHGREEQHCIDPSKYFCSLNSGGISLRVSLLHRLHRLFACNLGSFDLKVEEVMSSVFSFLLTAIPAPLPHPGPLACTDCPGNYLAL